MRPSPVLLAVGGALAVVLPLSAGTALAACEAPSLQVAPAAALPGQTVTVTGRSWAAACHDTGQPEPAPPVTDLPLSLASAVDVVLARVDARADFTFTTQVVVPAGAPVGPTAVVVSVPATPSGTVHLAAVPFDVVSPELPRTAAPTRETAALAVLCLLLGAAALQATPSERPTKAHM